MKKLTEAELNKELDRLSALSNQWRWSDEEIDILRKALSKNVSVRQLFESWEKLTGKKRSYDALGNKMKRLEGMQ
jgi:hypothetical protein